MHEASGGDDRRRPQENTGRHRKALSANCVQHGGQRPGQSAAAKESPRCLTMVGGFLGLIALRPGYAGRRPILQLRGLVGCGATRATSRDTRHSRNLSRLKLSRAVSVDI